MAQVPVKFCIFCQSLHAKYKEDRLYDAICCVQDVNVYVSENDAAVAHDIELGEGRQAYLVAIEGSLDVNGTSLEQRDAAELLSGSQSTQVTLKSGSQGCHFMLVEMAAS